jgi:hypothetical protein
MMKFRAQARHVLPVVTLVCGVLANPAPAQFGQQGPKLVGTGAIGGAQQGIALSLSGDGSTGIVGGSSDNGSAGAAWVYSRSGGYGANKQNWSASMRPTPHAESKGFPSRCPLTGIPPLSVPPVITSTSVLLGSTRARGEYGASKALNLSARAQ